MRLATLVLALLAAPALAQPDPNPPASYFPLAVGHAWEYEVTVEREGRPRPPLVYRDSLVADTTLGGARYLVQERVRLDLTDGFVYAEPLQRTLLRFDETAAHVVRRTDDGGEVPYLTPCPFDVAFDAAPFACDGGGAFAAASAEASVSIGPRGAPADAVSAATKSYVRGEADSLVVASGLGIVYEARAGDEGVRVRTLRYARLGGTVVGAARVPGLVVEADPNDAADYYPLAVGNAWEYRNPSPLYAPFRREVVGDTLIDGLTYSVLTTWMPEGYADSAPPATHFVRFDSASAALAYPDRPDSPGCRLDYPVYSGVTEAFCASPTSEFLGIDRYSATHEDVFGSTRLHKTIGSIFSEATHAPGIGPTEIAGENYLALIGYARIDGVEYGTPTLEYLAEVDAEGGADPDAFEIGAYPNPFAERATLRLTVPAPDAATVEVLDLLGRRVQRLDLGVLPAGARPLRVGDASWAAGVYLVRVRTESGRTAVLRLTKR